MYTETGLDHQYIDEHNIASRYLTRKLEASERSSFEEHFADCPECMDRLALAEIFLGRSQAAAPAGSPRAVQVAPAAAKAPEGFWARLDRQPRGRLIALAVLVVSALVGMPSAFFLGESTALRARLAEGITEWRTVIEDAAGNEVWPAQDPRPGTYTLVVKGRAGGKEVRLSTSKLRIPAQ